MTQRIKNNQKFLLELLNLHIGKEFLLNNRISKWFFFKYFGIPKNKEIFNIQGVYFLLGKQRKEIVKVSLEELQLRVFLL